MRCPLCEREFPLLGGGAIRCERKPCAFDLIVEELRKAVLREPILVEREKTHGDFRRTAAIALELKHIFRRERQYDSQKRFNESGISDFRHGEALDMIATKLARILSGDMHIKDHWADIAGYAKLGEEACE